MDDIHRRLVASNPAARCGDRDYHRPPTGSQVRSSRVLYSLHPRRRVAQNILWVVQFARSCSLSEHTSKGTSTRVGARSKEYSLRRAQILRSSFMRHASWHKSRNTSLPLMFSSTPSTVDFCADRHYPVIRGWRHCTPRLIIRGCSKQPINDAARHIRDSLKRVARTSSISVETQTTGRSICGSNGTATQYLPTTRAPAVYNDRPVKPVVETLCFSAQVIPAPARLENERPIARTEFTFSAQVKMLCQGRFAGAGAVRTPDADPGQSLGSPARRSTPGPWK